MTSATEDLADDECTVDEIAARDLEVMGPFRSASEYRALLEAMPPCKTRIWLHGFVADLEAGRV